MNIKDHLRFWSYVRRDSTDGCWIWTGSRESNGYGSIRVQRRTFKAHRLMWMTVNGDPGDLLVCHKCDVKPCVNPAHLFLGTNSDNIQDMYNKGLDNLPRGERHYKAKLTAQQVRDIRALSPMTNKAKKELAAKLGVSWHTVRRISIGQLWRSVR